MSNGDPTKPSKNLGLVQLSLTDADRLACLCRKALERQPIGDIDMSWIRLCALVLSRKIAKAREKQIEDRIRTEDREGVTSMSDESEHIDPDDCLPSIDTAEAFVSDETLALFDKRRLMECAYRRGFSQGVAAAVEAVAVGYSWTHLCRWRDRVLKWRCHDHKGNAEFPEWLGRTGRPRA